MQNVETYNKYHFNEGKLEKGYDLFGAHIVKDDNGNHKGVMFRTYAPNARIISVVGDFNNWDSRTNVMNNVMDSGIYEAYIENAKEWDKYRFCIVTKNGKTLYKSDPYGFFSENRPMNCSKVYDIDGFEWHDKEYLEKRKDTYPKVMPLSIYEMNVGSWMMKPGGEFNKYNDLPEYLIPYLKKLGFNAVEFMPLIEFPLDESWGYQGTGYFSMTSRYGVPKDLMYLIDELHKNNIKVIFDWVPGHICKDAHGLYEYDGTHIYEYDDDFRRENIVWGTANIDFSKGASKSFFLSNAMFFMEYFHIDGFRLDAVSNIYYYLGNENNGVSSEGVGFLKDLSIMVKAYDKGVILSAEDSTTFPNVTKPVEEGGVGFDFKWNMGWMNDTLKYFSLDPVYRKYHHNLLTFSLCYSFSENFILPLSHDEVVHGKGSLIEKMPGDYWQKFANFRSLMGWFVTHPGKKLLFMGSEFAQFKEWNEKCELDWFLLQYDKHKEAQKFIMDIFNVYKYHSAFSSWDDSPSSFNWIDCDNKDQSVFIYERKSDDESMIVVLNLTPNSYNEYRIGVPYEGTYTEIINSDKKIYGGSDLYNGLPLKSEHIPKHKKEQSINIVLSSLSVTIFEYKK